MDLIVMILFMIFCIIGPIGVICIIPTTIGIFVLLLLGGSGDANGSCGSACSDSYIYEDNTGTDEWLKPSTKEWRMSHPSSYNQYDWDDPWGEEYRDDL